MVRIASKSKGSTKVHFSCEAFPKRQIPSLEMPQDRLLRMGLSPATAQVVSAKLMHISETQKRRLVTESAVASHCPALNLPALLSKFQPRSHKTAHRKLAVFDLDETLVLGGVTAEEADLLVELEDQRIGVKIRPYARDCLLEVGFLFEVAIFTASQRSYADQILDFLDPTGRLIQHRLYRDSCVQVGNMMFKDLRVLPFALKDVVMVDNSLFGYLFQRANGVPVSTWTGSVEDEELKTVPPYLRLLSTLSDVRPFNLSVFGLLY